MAATVELYYVLTLEYPGHYAVTSSGTLTVSDELTCGQVYMNRFRHHVEEFKQATGQTQDAIVVFWSLEPNTLAAAPVSVVAS